jgi:iron complex outermembrane recepter protein
MATNRKLQTAVRLALGVSAGLLAVSVAPSALAQDEGAEQIEEITVTGSRIKRKDFESNAPVFTMGSEQFDITGTVNAEQLLNTLPQAVPGLDRSSNNPGGGFATVNLRGLGSNRTLVLINGTRVIPTTSGGSVDINIIPTALIENVEVLTGGASAVYGSDAIAGVINFKMKDDFEGAQLNARVESTEKGDGAIYSTDLTIGANMFDGRGNVVMNFSYTSREALFQGDRDFAFFAQFDDEDENGNPILINGGSSGIPGTSIFSGAFATFAPESFGATFNQDGSIRPFDSTSPTGNDFYNYAPVNYIQLPQERYQVTTLGHFDVNDKLTMYGYGMFTSSKVPQQLAPTPIFQTSTATIGGSPFLDANAQQVLSDAFGDGIDSDGDGIDDTGTAFFRRRLVEVGPRVANNNFTSYQIKGGAKGDFTDNWGYDAYVQYGNTTASEVQLGNVNRDRFQQALLLDLDADPSGGTCQDPSANGSTIGCSPINIFGEGNISEDGAAFIRTAVASTTDYVQLIAAATVTGTLGEKMALPGGEIGLAFGYEHIEDKFNFRPSQDIAAGTIAGFNGAPPVSGGFNRDSLFVEAYLPILSGVPGFDLLDMELAFRTTDYTTAGKVNSYKIAGSWAPVEQIRFRAGFNRAVRAPSIGELFSPQGENFPGSADPCAAEGNPNPSPELIAICESTGVPAGLTGSPALDLAAGQVRELSGGNPDLFEESADTYTLGAVWTPTFVDGLSLSVDYFDILIEDYVADFGGGANNALNICYDPSDPSGGIGSDFCNIVNRRVDGTIEFVSITTANVASLTLKGVDILANYDFELFSGDMQIAYVATVTTEQDFTAFTGAKVIECAGNYGLDCGQPLPEYKHRMTFNWSRDNFLTQLTWRYLGKVNDDNPDVQFFTDSISARSYFDMTGIYDFTDNISATLGIRNLLDKGPPILGDNAEQANTYPATYDVYGRAYFLTGTFQF